jgi:hypothetical protein
MSQPTLPARRRALKLIGGIPMLPLSTSLAAAGLTACGGGSDDPAKTAVSAEFVGMGAPSLTNAAAMATTTVGSRMIVTFDDKSTETYALGYQPFFVTGTSVPDGKGGTLVAGGYYDINNKPILDSSTATSRQFFSDCPDGSSLLTLPSPTVSGVKGNTVFAVVQFEYVTRNLAGANDALTDATAVAAHSMYGKLPSPIAVLTLDQDKSTGALSLVKYHNVDTSSVKGLWITCGASLSPWGTHLSSEEYEPDAFDQGVLGNSLATLQAFSQNLFGSPSTANPYDYGHLPEVTVNADGTGSIRKH